MKPIIISIFALVFSLSSTTLTTNLGTNVQKTDMNISQDQSYFIHDQSFIGKELVGPGCTACHMEYSVDGKSAAAYLNENYDGELIVHQEDDLEFVESLESFLEDHTKDEAADKYVDYQKVVVFLNGF